MDRNSKQLQSIKCGAGKELQKSKVVGNGFRNSTRNGYTTSSMLLRDKRPDDVDCSEEAIRGRLLALREGERNKEGKLRILHEGRDIRSFFGASIHNDNGRDSRDKRRGTVKDKTICKSDAEERGTEERTRSRIKRQQATVNRYTIHNGMSRKRKDIPRNANGSNRIPRPLERCFFCQRFLIGDGSICRVLDIPGLQDNRRGTQRTFSTTGHLWECTECEARFGFYTSAVHHYLQLHSPEWPVCESCERAGRKLSTATEADHQAYNDYRRPGRNDMAGKESSVK